MSRTPLSITLAALLFGVTFVGTLSAQVLDKGKLLEKQRYLDNRDTDWYTREIPFFECPDEEITTTYYYRWELLTKHLTYGSPNTGYSFTEFIDRPFWSGAYGAISCPAGHQLYEARWLRSPLIANDYTRYWFRTPGAQPRNYSTWLADSAWAVHRVHPDEPFLINLLPDLIRNYEEWEKKHFVPEVGLFWQTGHDDGMEFNINSRQTQDILRGAPSFRPSFNAYMWADAKAISRLARLANDPTTAERFETKANALQSRVLELLWDPKRSFFFPMYRDNEERDGYRVTARSLTYQSGQYAGSPFGRELIGYVPWQFGMVPPGKGYDAAWNKLMDRDGFFAEFGPTTVERKDPMFLLKNSCCWWSGQSWPYATTQTLAAMAHVARQKNAPISAVDYAKLLGIYARSHRKNGKPYLAEALHPDTGSFDGHDGYNHSEHYFHSAYCDLVITGLVGLIPRDDSTLEISPLVPSQWSYFAVEDLPYRGHRLTILWDRNGNRYRHGAGLTALLDGKEIAHSDRLQPLVVEQVIPIKNTPPAADPSEARRVNYLVNNDGNYFPRLTASYTSPLTSLGKLTDGNAWYTQHPPNRWSCLGTPNKEDTIIANLGAKRRIDTIKLYLLDDEGEQQSKIAAPSKIQVEVFEEGSWKPLDTVGRSPSPIVGHRPHVLEFPPREIDRFRVILTHRAGSVSGLTEIEAWGEATGRVVPAQIPAGNLAYAAPDANGKRPEFPKASASHTSRYDRVDRVNDGITIFDPNPNNRWTSYESKNTSDWLEIDFGKPMEFRRVDIAIFDDHGGVQVPDAYKIEYFADDTWKEVTDEARNPKRPAGGTWNEARFAPVTSPRLRITFTHKGPARSGVTELMVWND